MAIHFNPDNKPLTGYIVATATLSTLAIAAIGTGALAIAASQGINVGCFNALGSITVYGGTALCALPALVTYVIGSRVHRTLRRRQAHTRETHAAILRAAERQRAVHVIEKWYQARKAQPASPPTPREITLDTSLIPDDWVPDDLGQNPTANASHPKYGKKKQDIFIRDDCVIRPFEPYRVQTTQRAYALCQELELTHVVVPACVERGRYSVEQRLPNENSDIARGACFYRNHHDEFTMAVEDFTHFLIHCSDEYDMIGEMNHPLVELCCHKDYLPRFDNVLMYEEEGAYKIGLIDFDAFKIDTTAGDITRVSRRVRTCAILFPYHVEQIIEIGLSYADITEANQEIIRGAAGASREFYEQVRS